MELTAYRRQRVADAATAAGFDLVVASLPENSAYLTGYRSVGQDVLHRTQAYTVYVPGENRVIYVMGLAEVPSIVECVGREAEIFPFGNFQFSGVEGDALAALVAGCAQASSASPEEALAAAIRATGKTRIALDESRIAVGSWKRVAAACPGCDIEPGSDVFMQARLIKHPEEIAGIEQSAEIAEQCLMEALDAFRPGMTELELECLYRAGAVRRGADPYFFVGTAAKRAAYSDTVNTDLAIGRGDMIRFDFGVIYRGYCSDLARTASVGAPDAKLKAYYEAVQAGTKTAIAAMKPGATAEEIFAIAQDTTRRAGIPHYRRHHCGHGIGLETYDLPSVAPGCTTALAENMTFCIETPYYELGWGGVQIENTVAVTKTGARYLDKTGDDLIVLEG